jgi:hypothetical protein
MTTLKLRKWDSAQHLKTDKDMAAYLEACLQEAGDDAAFIAKDMAQESESLEAVDVAWVQHLHAFVGQVKVDLDAALPIEDE